MAPGSGWTREPAEVLVESGCAACHRFEPADASTVSIDVLAERRAPDLSYAGVKYRPDWLRRWLVDPTRIRPAGMFPADNTRIGEDGDAIDEGKLTAHEAVSAEEVDAIVAALGELRWGAERVAQPPPDVPTVPAVLARLNFSKFKGCGSCHRTAPDVGGVSGPELYSSFERLQVAFLWSYLADPQAWDPVAPMPDYGLPQGEVGKLLSYLQSLSEEQ